MTLDGVCDGADGALLPDPDDVRQGTDRGDGVLGSLVVPSQDDVRAGTPVDGTVGVCYVPAAGDVLWGVAVDDSLVGTLGAVALAGIAAIDPGTGNLTLTVGDDYLAAINRAVTFTDPQDGSWPATIGSCRLTVRQTGNDSVTQIDQPGTLIASSPRVVSFDLPHATTAAMTKSAASWDNRFSLTLYTAATYGGDVVTVLNDLPATIVAPLAE